MYNMEVINLASSPNRVCSTRCVIFTVSGLKGPLVSDMTILLNAHREEGSKAARIYIVRTAIHL